VGKEISRSKVHTMGKPERSRENRIIYNVLQFCNEEKKNKGFIIPMERPTARAEKAVGKWERMVKSKNAGTS
jgi:hypothetical protein